jgi:restriction system protein
MECPGPQHCADLILERLRAALVPEGAAAAMASSQAAPATTPSRQGILFAASYYSEDAPAIRSDRELNGAVEHLDYAVFRRYHNTLTRAERARLDNTIRNTLFKIDRYVERLDGDDRDRAEASCAGVREAARHGRERMERLRDQARRADLKLSQLGSLSPEGFEEFVAELFESLGYRVERTGGSGDEGVDLRLSQDGLRAVVQCKYHQSRGVIGSPDLQKFLGTIHHTQSHKGYFVTTRTFSLAAEKFVADHPIELIDGPRLVQLVEQALGPGGRDRDAEPLLFS